MARRGSAHDQTTGRKLRQALEAAREAERVAELARDETRGDVGARRPRVRRGRAPRYRRAEERRTRQERRRATRLTALPDNLRCPLCDHLVPQSRRWVVGRVHVRALVRGRGRTGDAHASRPVPVCLRCYKRLARDGGLDVKTGAVLDFELEAVLACWLSDRERSAEATTTGFSTRGARPEAAPVRATRAMLALRARGEVIDEL